MKRRAANSRPVREALTDEIDPTGKFPACGQPKALDTLGPQLPFEFLIKILCRIIFSCSPIQSNESHSTDLRLAIRNDCRHIDARRRPFL